MMAISRGGRSVLPRRRPTRRRCGIRRRGRNGIATALRVIRGGGGVSFVLTTGDNSYNKSTVSPSLHRRRIRITREGNCRCSCVLAITT
jgi:hypothetical protein